MRLCVDSVVTLHGRVEASLPIRQEHQGGGLLSPSLVQGPKRQRRLRGSEPRPRKRKRFGRGGTSSRMLCSSLLTLFFATAPATHATHAHPCYQTLGKGHCSAPASTRPFSDRLLVSSRNTNTNDKSPCLRRSSASIEFYRQVSCTS